MAVASGLGAGESVLVVGGAGYIGSHTSKALKARGFTPVVLDNLSMGHDWAVQFGPFVQGEAGDTELVRKTVREHNVVAAIHFAASAYVGESMKDPGKYFRNNVAAMNALLDALVAEGVNEKGGVIFSSSCATYGIPTEVPIPEDHAQNPISPYGESKLMGETLLRWFEVCHNLRYVALRYFNASGASPDGDIGEVHDPETHLIPLIMAAALGKREHIEVFGTDYPTPDGTAIRDYIHVLDLADAHVRALEHLLRGGESLKLNVGTGQGYSVKEVIAEVERVAGKPVPTKFGPRREGDPPALFADPAKTRGALGWNPEYSSLAQIVETAWKWEHVRAEKGF